MKLFLGIPIPIIILIALFVHDSHNNQESTPWQLATIEKTASVPCQISTETGALERYPYGFASRFEDDRRGTNPEEILTAAHAACFTMAFCFACDKVGLPLMQHLVDTHPGRLRLVFRHFPLMEVHPNAELAAEAAEAAAAQGRFWPMHYLLFAQPPGFFLNGQAVDVSFGFEKLEEAVQAALKAA